MKRKLYTKKMAIKKWKARLNIDGPSIKKGIHYEQKYAPVASWNSIQLLLTLSLVHKWKTVKLDCVLTFPQKPVEKEL